MTLARETRNERSDTPLDLSPSRVSMDEPQPLRLAVPLLLAAGWGALLSFSVMFLMEDGRNSVAASDRLAVADQSDGERILEPRLRRQEPASIVPAVDGVAAARSVIAVASVATEPPPAATPTPSPPPLLPPPPPPPSPAVEKASIERVNYVGTWGPTPQACGATSRRRGYLPALITEEGAKAGRTLCRFRNGRRDGIAWTVAADCSERGRRWTSQVRLLVDGDHLTWTSAKGAATYVRCGRRDG